MRVQCRFCRCTVDDDDSDTCPECGKGRLNDWAMPVPTVSKMEQVEFKPCPFCGGRPRISKIYATELFSMGCLTEGCVRFDGVFRTEEEAAHMWNRRFGP